MEGSASDSDLDRGMHELGACPQGLRSLKRRPIWQHQLWVDDHAIKLGGAADGGALANHVPVLCDRHTVVVAPDEYHHEPVLFVERGDRDPAGGERAGAVVLT